MAYRTVLIDPPWPERGGGKIKRGADRHYELIEVRDMPRVIYGSGVFELERDAHLYLCATNNYLLDAGWLMGALGFRYLTCITWPKERMGLGQYFRGKTEHVLFGVRGRGKSPEVHTGDRTLSTLLEGAEHVRQHSRKPRQLYELIEKRSWGPYLEMFATEQRDGWDGWGSALKGGFQSSPLDTGIKRELDVQRLVSKRRKPVGLQ